MRRGARLRLPWRIPSFGPAIETSLTTAEAVELRGLAQGRRVLEIGAAYGYSTVLTAQVAQKVTSIDPHEVHLSHRIFRDNLFRFGVAQHVDVVVGRSVEVLPGLRDGSFDFAFVDGDHTAAGVRFDLEQVQRLVEPGGLLAFHDWDEESCQDVRQVLEAWRAPGYLVDTLAVYRLA